MAPVEFVQQYRKIVDFGAAIVLGVLGFGFMDEVGPLTHPRILIPMVIVVIAFWPLRRSLHTVCINSHTGW